MNERQVSQHTFPRLPVLGWSAYSGKKTAPIPSVLSTRSHKYTISGRAAIALALRALGNKSGDKVLMPTYHCPTMITPVIQAGAWPIFYPITASGSPDLHWLEQADLTGVRIMLAAHYFGLLQPMSRLREFCTARRIALIEDCAHAFFGISENCPIGSSGDVAIASLTKFFPVTEGGVIVSDRRLLDAITLSRRDWLSEIKAIADTVELGVEYGRFPGLNSALAIVFKIKNWLRHRAKSADSQIVNTKGEQAAERLLSFSQPAFAARGITRSVHRNRIVELRRRNYKRLASGLSDIRGARVLCKDLSEGAAPYVFPLYVNHPEVSYQRLRSAGIPIFRWDEPWPGTPTLKGDYGLDWSTHIFQLGCHQDLSTEDIDAMTDTVSAIIQAV